MYLNRFLSQCNMIFLRYLQRHVCMFFPWCCCFLGGQQVQILTYSFSGGAGLNNIIYITSHSCRERVSKFIHVLLLLFRTSFSSEDDGDGSFASHDSHLGCWPSIVEVTSQVLGAHHVVGTTISFPDIMKVNSRILGLRNYWKLLEKKHHFRVFNQIIEHKPIIFS